MEKNYANISFLPGKAWLNIPQFKNHLLNEIQLVNPVKPVFFQDYLGQMLEGIAVFGDIIYSDKVSRDIFWHRVCLEKPFTANFSSISEAAAVLCSIQRNWIFYPFSCFRRAKLISEKLPFIRERNYDFPYDVPDAPIGLWTLLNKNTIFASANTSSPFQKGEIFFNEDKINPPSRAYLKMWESITLLKFYLKKALKLDGNNFSESMLPCENSICVDAGASPGGWTWVLNSLKCKVTAVDRSPLSEKLMENKNIFFIKHDAFTLPPEQFGKTDWVCSDVICYPERLYAWIQKWLASGLCDKFICTIKMQGEPNNEIVKKFAAIPNSKVIHLTANKHELTWLKAPFIL